MSKDGGKYEVGYKKPPKEYRFKKGQSGNRKGRPKGSKSTDRVILESLNMQMLMHVGGKPTKVRVHDGIIKSQVKKAIEKGDTRAGKLLLDLYDEAEKRIYRQEALFRWLAESLYEVFCEKAEKDPEGALKQLRCVLDEAYSESGIKKPEPMTSESSYDHRPKLVIELEEKASKSD